MMRESDGCHASDCLSVPDQAILYCICNMCINVIRWFISTFKYSFVVIIGGHQFFVSICNLFCVWVFGALC